MPSATTSKKTGNIEIKVVAYSNCDDVELFWRVKVKQDVDAAIPSSLGFMIERQRKQKDGTWAPIEILRNRVGFEDNLDDENVDAESDPKDRSQPSNVWPFQCYDWTDHGANSGQQVKYRVSAMKLPAGIQPGEGELDKIADSGWTGVIEVTADAKDGVSAYFNRGAVMSQYVARIARLNDWTPREIKQHIKELEEPLRRFLSGELRLALLRMLDGVIEDPGLEFYAALYELSDDELIDRLKLLRGRAHVVLSNGSDKSGDGNEDARKHLKKAKVDVRDRLLGNKGLGHNKFAVVTRKKDGKPVRGWTGSTNWAATGLCTQLNNGISFENGKIAQLFRDQWDRLADAESGFPAELVQANAESPRSAGDVDVWFTRVRNKSTKNKEPGSDIEALIDAVNGARHSILYVMFQPGQEPLKTILQRAEKGLYVRGVVSTVTATNEEAFTLTSGLQKAYKTALVQPDGIETDFSWWVGEVTRKAFLMPFQNPGIGHAITHAKMIVIDPLSDSSVVITGSHNFSVSASEQNDDNFVVIRGNQRLAEAYAVACLGTYRHYRWRAYVKDLADKGKQPWSSLSDSPGWQEKYLTKSRRKHLETWCP